MNPRRVRKNGRPASVRAQAERSQSSSHGPAGQPAHHEIVRIPKKTTGKEAAVKRRVELPADGSAAWRKARSEIIQAAKHVAPKARSKASCIALPGPQQFRDRVCRVADHFNVTVETFCHAALWHKLPRERRAA